MTRTGDTPPTLTFTAPQIETLRDHLLREDGLERIAIAFCSESGDNTLLAEELHLPADDEYGTKERLGCRLDLDVEHELLNDCCSRGMHPVIIHSHPFDPTPTFSHTDARLMPQMDRFVTGLHPDATVVFAVLGDTGMDAAVIDGQDNGFTAAPVTIVGDWMLDTPLTTPTAQSTEQADVDLERTDRSARAFTEYGQQQLAATHVAIIGAGGLGSIMAEQFARTGVGEITIVDPDIVEKSNLNRLFGAYDHHIGRPKVDAIEEELYKANPNITVNAIQKPAQDAADALKQCDLLVGGVDRMSARMWLNRFAVRHLIPYVDAGVVIETSDEDSDASTRVDSLEGYIQFIVPGVTACFSCLERDDPKLARLERLDDDELQEEIDRGYIDADHLTPEPALAALNGVIASKTALLVSKWATGYAPPEHWIHFEDTGNTLTSFTTTPKEPCPVCSDDGFLGRGDREVTSGEVDTDRLDLNATVDLTDTDPESGPTESADDHGIWAAVTAYFARLHPV